MKLIKKDNQSINRYSPMRSLFDDFFAMPSLIDDMVGTSFTSKDLFADIWEEDNNLFVKMALPGINKEDITITTSSDSVTIKAASKQEEKEDDKKKYYYKAMETSYEQTFNLPTQIDADSADATYVNGVLTLKLPKVTKSNTKNITIK